MLRSKRIIGMYELDELIVESNGELSYTKKDSEGFSHILIDKGMIHKYGLKMSGKNDLQIWKYQSVSHWLLIITDLS